MKSIGGYFELELRSGEHYHKNAIKLNTARNCLEYILLARRYKKIYIPYYTCEVVLEPIRKLGVEFEFYSIDKQLNPIFDKTLQEGEALLYTNYFGLKQRKIEALSQLYKNLIVDNSQAFFSEPLDCVDTFYSARKFFGVADGGYLYTDCPLQTDWEQDYSSDRISHLIKRIDYSAEEAFHLFRENDDSLSGNPIRKMSHLTAAILCSIDYKKIKQRRRENYLLLDRMLRENNQLFLSFQEDMVPMIYPYWGCQTDLKEKLIRNKVYIATYWPNVFKWVEESQLEYLLAKNIIALPIDQRYGKDEIETILKMIR